ncbi:MAG: thioredoxin family protein [Chlamydiota bacterium]
MKKLLLFFLSLIVMNSTSSPLNANSIEWITNFEVASSQAKEQNKPIALFFTGSDWCTWCNKLSKEALETPEFADTAADKFIFVKLDYPMKTKQPDEMIHQNRELQQHFDIKSFPTILILTPDQKEIGVTGYREGGGKEYAEHLLNIANDYVSYSRKLKQIKNLSGTELKNLYHKAQEFHLNDDEVRIVLAGMKSERQHFFLVERYRQLANEGRFHEVESQVIREEILSTDPTNRYLSHYQVACIDFDAYADEMNLGRATPDKAVSPLVQYIERFGDQDLQNLWRINMIISQVYRDVNDREKALKYAECAFDCAPNETKKDIAMAIDGIKGKR